MTRFAEMLKIYMRLREVGTRELAREIGCSPSTITRITQGKTVSSDVFSKVLRWSLDHA